MTASDNNYPPDMEPLEPDSQIYDDLATFIEDHEGERTREELLHDMKIFAQYWIATGDMTGDTW